MIPPVNSKGAINFQMNYDTKSREQIGSTRKILSKPKEWYCSQCLKFFVIPRSEEKDRAENLKCPFCGNKEIHNNRSQYFRENLWRKT